MESRDCKFRTASSWTYWRSNSESFSSRYGFDDTFISPNARSPELAADLPSLQEELSDILSAAADLSNKFVAKVIGYRSEQHAQLDLPSFLEFFHESWNFVVKCEVMCRRMIVGLRGTILSQVSKAHVPAPNVDVTCIL